MDDIIRMAREAGIYHAFDSEASIKGEHMTTGWPPGLLQDDERKLSRWLASRPDALYQLRKNMTQDIIAMAREAGIHHAFDSEGHWDGLTDQKLFDPHPHPNDVVYGDKRTVEILERFDALIRADEREACLSCIKPNATPMEVAAAIRARGQA
jgi:hypothetical protein